MSRVSAKPKGHIHARSLKTNAMLQRVDALLSDLRPHTTLKISRGARVCAMNSIISELRVNGRKINTHQHGKLFYHRRVK